MCSDLTMLGGLLDLWDILFLVAGLLVILTKVILTKAKSNEISASQSGQRRPARIVVLGILGEVGLLLAGLFYLKTIRCAVAWQQWMGLLILIGSVVFVWVVSIPIKLTWFRILVRASTAAFVLTPFIPHRSVEWSSAWPPAGLLIFLNLTHGKLITFELVTVLIAALVTWLSLLAIYANLDKTKITLPLERCGIAIAASIIGICGVIFTVVTFIFAFIIRLRSPQDFFSKIIFSLFGINGSTEKALFYLALFGLPALIIGTVALAKIKKSKGTLSGKVWALGGTISGSTLMIVYFLLLVSPISTKLEANYAQNLLESTKGLKKDWNYGNIVHKTNITLGSIALKDGKIEEAKRYLLEAGKTPGSPQLNSFGPDFSLVKLLMEKGEKKVVLEYLDLVGKFWANPKNCDPANYNSVRLAQDNADKLLMWKNEIMEGKNPWLSSPSSLQEAAISGNIKTVRQLIKAGADVNLKRTDGVTALHLAILNNRTEVVKLLIREGADVNAESANGQTPLHLAVNVNLRENNLELIKLLIDAGADANAFDANGETPLDYALANGKDNLANIFRSGKPSESNKGIWQIIDDDLVKVSLRDGNCLMWPRRKTCLGTNNNIPINWQNLTTFQEPKWNNTINTYNYGTKSKSDYPALAWSEDLVYKGYSDWRLPTLKELKQLSDYGQKYIEYDEGSYYWSSSARLQSNPFLVNFKGDMISVAGVRDKFFLRAVRQEKSETRARKVK